jgi:anti-anti-sigma factor
MVAGPVGPLMTIGVEDVGAVLRVTLSGELDLASFELFDGLFDLGTDGVDTVVLDLAAMSFCDVTGANALTGFRSFHRHEGREVEFLGLRPQVLRLMTIIESGAGASGHLPR